MVFLLDFNTLGNFFITLVLQNASIGFLVSHIRIPMLVKWVFDVRAIFTKRSTLREKIVYRKESETFEYGYYYALCITIANIAIVFS